MINTIIFDMDGVIIDSEPVHFTLIRDMLAGHGVDLTEEEHSKYVGRSDFWSIVADKYAINLTADELHERHLDNYMTHLKNSYDKKPINGVVDLIERLHSAEKKLVLASSATRENIRVVLDMYALENYFGHWISGAELGTSKPHPEIFLKAAEMAKSEPGECLVIEDSENGVRAAKAARMICIGYRNPNSGEQDLSAADYVIERFSEFDLERFTG